MNRPVPDDDLLRRLLSRAHEHTAHLDVATSAVELYEEAAAVAVQKFPEPLGSALAGVLMMAAYERRNSRLPRGLLGASNLMLSLALAVTEEADVRDAERGT